MSPFQYFGVYDDTDYSSIRWLGTHYDDEQLTAAQLRQTLADKIYDAWNENKQTRTIGFCSSMRQADFLASYFQDRGVAAGILHSGTNGITRGEAINSLTSGNLEVIFTVDLFNEGVDIPSVDTLLLFRPTESLTAMVGIAKRGESRSFFLLPTSV